MKIIPVIDLKNGYVVHAKRGQRENYQPIQSHLCKQADIFSVIEHFLSLYAFDTFYIADLDAITFSGNNQKLIEKTLAHFPKKQFWIDTGYQKINYFPENYLPVLGSECFNNDNVDELLDFKKRFVTSLDFDISDNPLGATRLFHETQLWSDDLILMTLSRVGHSLGLDWEKLRFYCEHYPNIRIIAAGGLSSLEELCRLKQIGVKAVLTASALHSGKINQQMLNTFFQSS